MTVYTMSHMVYRSAYNRTPMIENTRAIFTTWPAAVEYFFRKYSKLVNAGCTNVKMERLGTHDWYIGYNAPDGSSESVRFAAYRTTDGKLAAHYAR